MLCKGILNPALLELHARIRHTNTLVIADRGFTVQYANLIIESA